MQTVIRVIVMYFMVWGAFRILGKRELSRMSPLELVLVLFIPQLFSRALTRQDYSFTNAMIGATTLLSLVFLSSALSYRFKGVAYVMVPKPTVLVEHGRFVAQALNEERISPRDVFDAMQKAGIVALEASANATSFASSAGESGSRIRSTSAWTRCAVPETRSATLLAQTEPDAESVDIASEGTFERRSPTATSICGSRVRIDIDSTSLRSAGSNAESFGGSTRHSSMSAT